LIFLHTPVAPGAPRGVAAAPGPRPGEVLLRWEPALDINRIIIGGQIVAVVALFVLRSIVRTRLKHAAKT
jgi:hypothetical protein